MVNETGNKMDRQTSLSCMVIFARSISIHTIKARQINVKGEMFIWEWDKENVRVPFSDKNLSEIRNATSWVKTFQITKSKQRQDVHDSRYTKNHSLLFLADFIGMYTLWFSDMIRPFSSPEPLGLICNRPVARAPRFPTTWPRNDGLWGRECDSTVMSRH